MKPFESIIVEVLFLGAHGPHLCEFGRLEDSDCFEPIESGELLLV